MHAMKINLYIVATQLAALTRFHKLLLLDVRLSCCRWFVQVYGQYCNYWAFSALNRETSAVDFLFGDFYQKW